MKKETPEKVSEKANEKAVIRDSIKDYFTKDFMDSVNGMTHDEMVSSLKDLEATRYWIAIVKYSHERLSNAQNALITLDPFKDPTSMARYQGIMGGISDLQEAVISLKRKAEKSVEPGAAEEKAKEELGGAYGVI